MKTKENYKADYLQLKEVIEQQTDFKVSFEGIYKCIAFINSKQNDILPVPNRYFGAFEDGNKLKIRGIKARSHDTPIFFSKFRFVSEKQQQQTSDLFLQYWFHANHLSKLG